MRKISCTRLLAAAVGCFAIAAAASVSLADDQPTTTQPSQPAGSLLDPASAPQPTTTTPATPPVQSSVLSQPATPATPPSASPSTQPSTSAARSGDSANWQRDTAKSNAPISSNPGEWPAPRRYDPNNPQGGSLGVNVVSDGGGIYISSVRPGTPAQQMGLQERDHIESVNGQPVEAVDQFISIIRNMNAGQDVEIGIVRDQAENKLHGKLEAYSNVLARGTSPNRDEERDLRSSGRFSNRSGDGMANPNVQTSYEERGGSGQRVSGDIDSRLTALEQQVSELRKEIGDIRTAIVSNPSTSALSPSATPAPLPGAVGSPNPRTPGMRTPGASPNTR